VAQTRIWARRTARVVRLLFGPPTQYPMAQHYELSASQKGTSPVPTSTSICDKYGCDWASVDTPRQQLPEPVNSQGRALLAAAEVSSTLVGTSTDTPKLRNERRRGGDAGPTWEPHNVPTPLRSASRAMRLRSRSTAGLVGQSRQKEHNLAQVLSPDPPVVMKEPPVDSDRSPRLAAVLCQAQKAQLTELTEALKRDQELSLHHEARRAELDGHIAELSEALQERDRELERARGDCEQVRRQCLERDEVWLRVVTQTEADLRATQDELASERETMVRTQIEHECVQSRLRQAHADDLDNRLSEFVDTVDGMEAARASALAAREDAERQRCEMEQAWNKRLSQVTAAMNEQRKREQELAEAAQVDGDRSRVVEECFAALAQRDLEIDETRRELQEAKTSLANHEACWRRQLAQVEATAASAAAAQTAALLLAPQRETYKVPAPLSQCITRSMQCQTFSVLPELLTPVSRQAATFERGEPLAQQRVSQRLQFGSPSALSRVDSSAQSTTSVLCWSPRHSPRLTRVAHSAMPAITLQHPTTVSSTAPVAATTAAITTSTRYLCSTPRLSGCKTVAGCASRALLVRSPSQSHQTWRPAALAALSPRELQRGTRDDKGEGLMSQSIFARSAAVLPQVELGCSCRCSNGGSMTTMSCSPGRAVCSLSTVPGFARVPSMAALSPHRDSTPQRQCIAQRPMGQPARPTASSPRAAVSPRPSPRASLRGTTPRMTPGGLSPRTQGSSLGVTAGSSIKTPAAAVAAAIASATVAAATPKAGCRREPLQKQLLQASTCSPSHSASGVAAIAPTPPRSAPGGNGCSPMVRWECKGSPAPHRHVA